MLSRLLHVRHPKAKQAVITAIDLLGLELSFQSFIIFHSYYYRFHFLTADIVVINTYLLFFSSHLTGNLCKKRDRYKTYFRK